MYDTPDSLREIRTEALILYGLHLMLVADWKGEPLPRLGWEISWELLNRLREGEEDTLDEAARVCS